MPGLDSACIPGRIGGVKLAIRSDRVKARLRESFDRLARMKSKKLHARDSIYAFKKSHAARSGLLCFALTLCFMLTVFREGNLVTFFLDNPSRIAILGKESLDRKPFWCDRRNKRTDVCILRGDVHVVTGNSSSVVLHSRSHQRITNCDRVERIQPYARKWETQTMASVKPIELKCIPESPAELLNDSALVDSCDVKHAVPAVLFSSAGFTGNPYHDFQDVLIPLYIVSQHLKGEVVFVVSDIRTWWVKRWRSVLHQLSRYPVIDFEENTGDQCFPEVMVGLYIHREFGITPSLMPDGKTMEDFQRLLHDALATVSAPSKPMLDNAPLITHSKLSPRETRTPKLLIVARKETRVLINLRQMVKLALELRYQVKVVSLSDQIDLQTIYGWFHASDVVMGVHGAELAHMMFMRKNAVIVQIVPLGTEWPALQYFARPAPRELGLQYIEYRISPAESSLSEKYGLWHPIVRNPASYIAKGWATQKQLYLTEQNVSPSVTRLRHTLQLAKSKALSAFP